MKTKTIMTLFFANCYLFLYSQVGINVDNPIGMFHIDPTGNNVPTEAIVVTADGNMGIGVTAPTAKLDLNGSLIIKDGTEGDGKILVSKNNGLAYWDYKTLGTRVFGSNIENMNNSVAANSQYMGLYITLAPGTWQLSFNSVYKNKHASESINILWEICTSNGSNSTSTRVGRFYSYTALPGCYSSVNATTIITNSGSGYQSYYIWAADANASSSINVERVTGIGYLWAVAVGLE